MFLLWLLTCSKSATNLLMHKSTAGSCTGLGHVHAFEQWKTHQRTQRRNILLQIIYVELYTRAKNTFHAPPRRFVTFGILCECLCLFQGGLWRSLCLLTCRSDREGCETLLGGWIVTRHPRWDLGSEHSTSARTPLCWDSAPSPGCCGHAVRKQAALREHCLAHLCCVLVSLCTKPAQIYGSAWEPPPSLSELSGEGTHLFYRQHLLAL